MKNIKLFDPVVEKTEIDAVVKTIKSGNWASGDGKNQVYEFEKKFILFVKKLFFIDIFFSLFFEKKFILFVKKLFFIDIFFSLFFKKSSFYS